MEVEIRPATPLDHQRLIQIAAEGDFIECDLHYLAFVACWGKLLCVTVDGVVVGYGGMVPVGEVAMITDLFVTAAWRSQGVGGRLLEAVIDGWPRRMTFSAPNDAALAAYRRVGMVERGRVLYLSGVCVGGGPRLQLAEWMHDRRELVDYFAAQGATITANAVLLVNSVAVKVVRLDTIDTVGDCDSVLRAFEAGTEITMYVPEAHGLARWLQARDFVVIDHDVLCTSAGVDLPRSLAVLHPGLA